MASKHKVFMSYYHAADQEYKEALLWMNSQHDIFIDASVDTGDIDDRLSDTAIREKIRDEYLRDSSVTVVLVGVDTWRRKHVDWEIYSSMHDGKINKKSGILVITLPTTGCTSFTVAHGEEEKAAIYPEITSWTSVTSRAEYDRRYPFMPDRIVDNLLEPKAKVSVTNWDRVWGNPRALWFLVELTYRDRANCQYDLSRPMRRANS